MKSRPFAVLRTFAFFAAAAAVTTLPAQQAATPPAPAAGSSAAPAITGPEIYKDPTKPVEDRVNDLLARLTPEQKGMLIHSGGPDLDGPQNRFTTIAIPELGIPLRTLSDGPFGVRRERDVQGGPIENDYSTAFPAGECLASTWNPELAFTEGQAIGEEALKRGKNIMLGPGVNIVRTPLGGRTFEYYGEDPYLTGRMAVGFIKGEQSNDIASSVKHFALNDEEIDRNTVDVRVDERPLREIYLPAFEAAVKEGKVWTVMSGYNGFRGSYDAENDYLLNTILKGQWGFQGLVMSDWGGTHSTEGSALHGLDLEMATAGTPNFGPDFINAVVAGTYPMSVLDDKVRRNLRVMISTHILDPGPRKPGSILTPEHLAASQHVAEQGMVLLKNEKNALPLDATKLTKVAIIGENATHLQAPGGVSSEITTPVEITPLEGITKLLGDKVTITYKPGYAVGGGRGGRRGAAPAAPAPDNTQLVTDAVDAAKNADVVIFIGGLNKTFDSEGQDRRDLKLPYGQDALIQQVIAANPKTIVVLYGGSPVEMGDWLKDAPALLYAWYGGSESGTALANILFGNVNPSGKLSLTFPKQLADSPAHALNAYPGVNPAGAARGGRGGRGGLGPVENYVEGLLVGYRWFDTKKIEPLFPFGYGLSYTTFAYSNLKFVSATDADPKGTIVNVQYDIQNTGAREGGETSQLYVHQEKSSVDRPEKELKGFKKVFLKPGEKQTVTIPLDQRSFAFYSDASDPAKVGWLAEAGDFKIQVGASSRDLRLDGTYHLASTLLVKP